MRKFIAKIWSLGKVPLLGSVLVFCGFVGLGSFYAMGASDAAVNLCYKIGFVLAAIVFIAILVWNLIRLKKNQPPLNADDFIPL